MHFTLNRLDLPSRYPCPSQEGLKKSQPPDKWLAEAKKASRETTEGEPRTKRRNQEPGERKAV